MRNNQSDLLIHQSFEDRVCQSPDAIAVTFQGQQLTYQALNQQANQVAHYLQSLGVQPETLVGVCIERSLDMLVVLLAVLKAGGAYVPLDPSYPADRIAYMVEASKLPILLTERSQLANLPHTAARMVVLEDDRSMISLESSENPISAVTAANVAYTIYTSGSTGNPKGVQVLHGAVVNFLESMTHTPGLTATETLLAVTTISFDIAVLELFLPLSVGAKIELVSREVAADGVRLAAAIISSGATFMQATPATWRLLLATGWSGDPQLKILCGGEAMNRNLADRLLGCCASLWNMYGPTETTIWSAVERVESGSDAVSIGYPINNTQIYIIDERCRRKGDIPTAAVAGQPGEIYIGGDGLARGYLNQPEMTAERFVPDPFSTTPGARLYKTGDLARLRSDGRIQFMDRVDRQVKIRGYRIELGDVEAAISQYPDLKEAAAIVREDSAGEKRIVAYFVSSDNTDISFKLRLYLKDKLPEYMVPTTFVMMDTMPLTPNGKIDRRALPAPGQTRPPLPQLFVAPCTPIEQTLAEIWSQILGINGIGVDDNFFDLGGHSLFIAQMMIQLEAVFEVKLPLSSFFDAPTINQLAQSIKIHQQPELAELLGKSAIATKLPDLSIDSILDPRIVITAETINVVSEPQNILLTGATGFLGAFLLDELLKSTQANIYCLVRCSSVRVGTQKLQRNLERYSLLDTAQSSRAIVIQGDLSQPLFGLSEGDFSQLAAKIDLIYHSGAFVNLVYPYAAMRDVNVLGTQEILRLASQVKVKPVHFISSLDVFQSAYHHQLAELLEDEAFTAPELPSSGYAQTKWVAEKLLKTAHARGIPTCIHRPGMIIGHSQTGFSNTEDTIGRLIKGLIQLGSAPTLALPMHLTPVEYVSKSIVELSSQPSTWGKAFHYSNPQPLLLAELVDYMRSLHYDIKSIDYDRWLHQLVELDSHQDNALKPIIPVLTTPNVAYSKYFEVLTLANVDDRNVQAGLAATSISCPEIDLDRLAIYFSYFTQTGFLDRPKQLVR